MPALIFFPWLSIDSAVDLPGLRLFAFRKGAGPRGLPHVTYKTIATVLSPYRDPLNGRIADATLLEFCDWKAGTSVPDNKVSRIFELQHLIAFSMLARRRFSKIDSYCNFDCFELVAQPYHDAGPDTFVLQTRTRHGATSHLWDSSSYPIQRPLHVPTVKFIQTNLLRNLIEVDLASDDGRRIFAAIKDFNYANTDAANAHEHIEIVMVASAMEFLFGIDDALKIAKRLESLVAPFRRHVVSDSERTAAASWCAAYPGCSVLQAWWFDLRQWRGDGAHGKKRGRAQHHWSMKNHLLFAARLFPLLVKTMLHSESNPALDELDLVALGSIERFLLHDHFQVYDRRKATHWQLLETEIDREYRSKQIRRVILNTLDQTGSASKPPE